MHPTIDRTLQRIRQRSAPLRQDYLRRVQATSARAPGARRLGCANLAHAYATLPQDERLSLVAERVPNLALVSAYNDMLSAHRPYEDYPQRLRSLARSMGASLQMAGGVPAMCDGVTQGQPGMELSLFSRDAIAMATAIALSHDVFDGALLLGVCDKIVPGLLIGALHFGHLPCLFVPAGPMSTGLANAAKAAVRERHAQGLATREELLAAEQAAYHGDGTCTFYGTANSNQMLLEAMGLHVPGAAFVHPHAPRRLAYDREAVVQLLDRVREPGRPAAIGRLVDECSIVNAMIALLATGGSTNHLIHWVAVARAAGIVIDWDDFDALAAVVPLLARIYPNGEADVNAFEAAGGPSFVLRELRNAGLLCADAATMDRRGLAAHEWAASDGEGALQWQPAARDSGDDRVLRPAARPFSASGGLKLLRGNLGRAVIKTSAVPEDRWLIEAPACVFDNQAALLAAFNAGSLAGDLVAVVRFQGPRANGMPELHKLMPPLAVLQGRGQRVALLTDGRLSGASGKVPAAIHATPEAADGGPLARLRDGDLIRLDARTGVLHVQVDEAQWMAREPAKPTADALDDAAHGMGRDLFAGMRRLVTGAEQGACTWL